MTTPNLPTRNENGFTITETLVTLVIIAIFLTIFFQAYMVMTSQRVKVARQAAASDIAYTNLRKISARPTGLSCQTDGYILLASTNGTDDTTRTFRPETDTSLGARRTQIVRAYPTVGDCTNPNDFDNNPVRIESVVTFDDDTPGKVEVTHASYIP